MKEFIASVDFEGTGRGTVVFLADVCCHLVLQGKLGHGFYNAVDGVCVRWGLCVSGGKSDICVLGGHAGERTRGDWERRRICGRDEFDLFRVVTLTGSSPPGDKRARFTFRHLPVPLVYSRSALFSLSCPQSDLRSTCLMQHLTLKHFILKQRALNLYRQAIRATKCTRPFQSTLPLCFVLLRGPLAIPDKATRLETIAWFRAEFERNRYITDVVSSAVSRASR